MRSDANARTGRGVSRPAVATVVGVLAVGGFTALFAGGLGEAPRGPIAVPNPDAAEAIVSEVDGVPHIAASAAPSAPLAAA